MMNEQEQATAVSRILGGAVAIEIVAYAGPRFPHTRITLPGGLADVVKGIGRIAQEPYGCTLPGVGYTEHQCRAALARAVRDGGWSIDGNVAARDAYGMPYFWDLAHP